MKKLSGGERGGRCTSDISDIIPDRFQYNGIPRAANLGFPRELLMEIDRYNIINEKGRCRRIELLSRFQSNKHFFSYMSL